MYFAGVVRENSTTTSVGSGAFTVYLAELTYPHDPLIRYFDLRQLLLRPINMPILQIVNHAVAYFAVDPQDKNKWVVGGFSGEITNAAGRQYNSDSALTQCEAQWQN